MTEKPNYHSHNSPRPPRWADRFLRWYCSSTMVEELQGDLHEAFYSRLNRISARKAKYLFIKEVLQSFKPSNIREDHSLYSSNNPFIMIGNYWRIAIRNLIKHKFYSSINILGLAIGMACCILITLFALNELSYDRFHEQADRIYRVTERIEVNGEIIENSASVPFPVGPTINNDYPDIIQTRLYQTFQKVPLLSTADKTRSFYEERLFFTDSTFFDVFSFNLISGDPREVLARPRSVVITESMAKKYFGSTDVTGKTLIFENALDLTITGVAEDPPVNSHFHFDFLVPLLNLEEIFQATGNTFGFTSWYWNPTHTYLIIPDRYVEQDFNKELVRFTDKNLPQHLKNIGNFHFEVQPMTDIHLRSDLYQEIEANGSEQSVIFALLIAGFILFIASINFINLTTARSTQRAREVAVRKILGSGRKQLIYQFFIESIITCLLALMIASILAWLFLPVFERLVDTRLNLPTLLQWPFISGTILTALFVGFLSGIYPALVLSGFKPLQSLHLGKGGFTGRRSSLLRKSLVVFQFAISIILLICTIVVFKQHRFLLNKELGFNEEAVIMVPIRGTSVKENYESFKTELTRNPGIISASAISDIIGNDVPLRPFRFEGMEEPLNLPGLAVDHDFLKTFDINLLEGRDFNREGRDDTLSIIINEAALELIQTDTWQDQRITWGDYRNVIGVTENFHYASLRQELRPLMIVIFPEWFAYIGIRLQPGNFSETIAYAEEVWKQFEAERPFVPFFLDGRLDNLYRNEKLTGQLVAYFSGLAIFIAVLGLLGLSTFATTQRVKEIGIRKVLGASASNIIAMLSRNFLILIGIANLFAWPVAWYFMDMWLQGFSIRIPVSLWIFPVTGILTLIITLAIVGLQSYKTSISNPVNSLRDE